MPSEDVNVTEGLDVTQTPAPEAPVEAPTPPAPEAPVLSPAQREKALSGIGEGQPTSGSGQ